MVDEMPHRKVPKTMPKSLELTDTLGDRMQRALADADLTQDDMALLLSRHRNAVGGWCRNKSTPCKAELVVFAQITGVTFSWLTTGVW